MSRLDQEAAATSKPTLAEKTGYNTFMSERTVGNYQILDEIARGGMGVVYRGRQPSLGRTVAIKMLLPQLAQDQEFRSRFHTEAAVVALLNHPNIVRIHDIETQDETYYIIMEFVAGPALRAVLEGGKVLAPGRAASLARQLALALAAAHAQGIVHRDIKPENLLLSPRGRLKVTDFGVAKWVSADLRTRTGMSLGTPTYMSPEQARGEKVDARSDLYSLAALLFEMATGHCPFSGGDPFAVAMKHITEPPPDPCALQPGLPPQLAAIILRGLAKDRAERFQTAAELAAVLAPLGAWEPTAEELNSWARCPSCGRAVESDDTACLGCGLALRQLCGGCGQGHPSGMRRCPFCWSVPFDPEAATLAFPTPPPGAPRPGAPQPGAPQLGAPQPGAPLPAPAAATAAAIAAGEHCQTCRGLIAPDFLRCPFCGTPIARDHHG